MKTRITFLIATLLITGSAIAQVSPHAAFTTPSNIVVSFTIPEGYKVYAESISATAGTEAAEDEVALTAVDAPEPVEQTIDGVKEKVYAADVTFSYTLSEAFTNAHVVTVGWQACTKTSCFMPEKAQFYAFESKEAEPAIADVQTQTPDRVLAAYANAEKFLEFLSRKGGEPEKQNPLERARAKGGILLLIGVILLGGVLLNFTPCVLPLIPVNLAILGIGTHAASRRQGLLVGSFFGLGITIAFGALGIISVLTGASFGTLQSSPIFNAAIAIIFCVLALAMLDVITIDFSRLGDRMRRKSNSGKKKPAALGMRLAGAFVAGAGSALLAGACVAPVLIWTLVMSASLVSAGQPAGAALPLFLGLGMGLPWAFFGGGVANLPRPGKWMNVIKIGFAIVFLVFAGIYARTAWHILRPADQSAKEEKTGIAWLASETDLETALSSATKPVLMYLTADWCGACRKMANTTFEDASVQNALKSYHAVKIDCTVFDDPEIQAIVKRLGAPGLPFFAIFDQLEE